MKGPGIRPTGQEATPAQPGALSSEFLPSVTLAPLADACPECAGALAEVALHLDTVNAPCLPGILKGVSQTKSFAEPRSGDDCGAWTRFGGLQRGLGLGAINIPLWIEESAARLEKAMANREPNVSPDLLNPDLLRQVLADEIVWRLHGVLGPDPERSPENQ